MMKGCWMDDLQVQGMLLIHVQHLFSSPLTKIVLQPQVFIY